MFVLMNNQPSETRSSARQLAKNYIDFRPEVVCYELMQNKHNLIFL